MGKLKDWNREQKRTTAFLREHKDEYYPKAKELMLLYCGSIAVMGFVFLAGLEISLTYESVFQAFWTGATFGLGLCVLGWGAGTFLKIAIETQNALKRKYNYNHVPIPPS